MTAVCYSDLESVASDFLAVVRFDLGGRSITLSESHK